jgi:MEMO1 family protein
MDENPKLRKIEILPIVEGDKKKLVLRDIDQYIEDVLTLPHEYIIILQFLDGKHSVRDIQAHIMREKGTLVYSEYIQSVIEILDKNHMLENENFEEYRKKVIDDFKSQKVRKSILPEKEIPSNSAKLREMINLFFSLDGASENFINSEKMDDLVGIISPHIDFDRGAVCYSYVLRELATRCDKKKFLIFGTSHKAMESYFSLTKKDFETPFGIAKTDIDFVEKFESRLGNEYIDNDFCHKGEHSIEFQVILLQYLLKDDPDFCIIPVLCGNMHESISSGVEPYNIPIYRKYIDTLKDLVSEKNDICIISGADLSHIGPRFGDKSKVTDYILKKVEEVDLTVLEIIEKNLPTEFFDKISKIKNVTRICGVAPILAQLYLMRDCEGKLIKYCKGKDPIQSVSFACCSFYNKDLG